MSSKLSELSSEQMESLQRRFWKNVQKTESCWLWTGYKIRNYGAISLGQKSMGMALAHRVSYFLEHLSLPDDLFICHHCDNPSCVRPDHLFPGTQKDNMVDCARKGRCVPTNMKGETHARAKLTQEQVNQIRSEFRPKYGAIVAIARRYGVGETTISNIVKRQTWKGDEENEY